MVVGCWLLVVGCWLLVVGCWLLVVGCWCCCCCCWLEMRWGIEHHLSRFVEQAKEKEGNVRAGCIIEQQENRKDTKKRKQMQKAKHVQMQ